MARSNESSKIANTIFSVDDFLYLLQLQEYYNIRYFLDLPAFFWKRDLQQRQKLEFTSRIKLTKYATYAAMTLFILSVVLLSLGAGLRNFLFLIIPTVILVFALIPLWVGLANVALSPLYIYSHKKRRRLAAAKVAKNKDMQIVAIAGSFGKTTTKNFIEQLIKHNFRIQMVPGNINTPTGIASWINSYLVENTQVLIVEMDTYELGEVRESCKIAPPDIALLTTVGDQHLLRFGGRANLAKALVEIYKYAKPSAKLVVSAEILAELDALAINYSEILPEAKRVMVDNSVQNVNNFSDTSRYNLAYALKVAELLQIPQQFIKDSLASLQLPERRQAVSSMHGFSVVDDSYNLSPTTAHKGLEYAKNLASEQGKKLLVITGGIPELGPENLDANYNYGIDLASKADVLVLLDTILADDIAEGLRNFPAENILSADRMSEAWTKIQANFKPEEYLVLMQPELNDLYY